MTAKDKQIWALVIAVLVIVVIAIWFLPRPEPQLVVEKGRQYVMVAFGSTYLEKDGKTIPTYEIVFTYPEGKKDRTGKIKVPKDKIAIDRTLPANGIVWDKPVTVEGINYETARWHPVRIEPAVVKPRVIEEPPLTRQK